MNRRREDFGDTLASENMLTLLRWPCFLLRNPGGLFFTLVAVHVALWCRIDFLRLRPYLTRGLYCNHRICQMEVFPLLVEIWWVWRLLDPDFWIVNARKLCKLLGTLKPVANDGGWSPVDRLPYESIFHQLFDLALGLLFFLIMFINFAETDLSSEGWLAYSSSPISFITIAQGSLISSQRNSLLWLTLIRPSNGVIFAQKLLLGSFIGVSYILCSTYRLNVVALFSQRRFLHLVRIIDILKLQACYLRRIGCH